MLGVTGDKTSLASTKTSSVLRLSTDNFLVLILVGTGVVLLTRRVPFAEWLCSRADFGTGDFAEVLDSSRAE